VKRIIYYILLFISIFCLQVSYVVAGSNKKLTSESIRLLAVGTTARGLVVMLDLSSGSGSNFIININGRDVEVNHRALAQYIKDDPDLDADKILLLSCSNFTAAQNLANKIGKRVIATDGIVRIYSDGGILSFNNGVKDKFEECVPNASRLATITQPRAPSSETFAYVSMGADDEMVAFLAKFTLPETKNAITGLAGDQQTFLADYKAAPAATFALFNMAITGPKMIEAWLDIKDKTVERKDIDVLIDAADVLINDEEHAPIDPTDLTLVAGTNYTVGTKGSWNRNLNTFPLSITNGQYVVTMYGNVPCTYFVNGGKVVRVTISELRDVTSDRNPYQQAKCKRIKDGDPSDDGGHLIGTQFGGTGDQINYVPMPISVNRSPGDWYKMEMAWASKIDNGIAITDIEIIINYGSDLKPTGFEVKWKENGVLNLDVRGNAGPALIIPN